MEKNTVVVFCFLFVAVQARQSMMELTREWKPNFGWEVVCSWQLFANDSLQSVRLSRADQQLFTYRPEMNGPQRTLLIRLPTMELQANCFETNANGVTGKCVLSFEMLQPMKEDFTYSCEVSGERPMFLSQSKTIDIEALVRPTDAVVERIGASATDQNSERVSVNCTSSGLPAPNLVWTIGDQKIPGDFSGSSWNFTSKLYHVWSSLSYTPADSNSHAVCTPETIKGGQLVKGQPAQFSSASDLKGITTIYICLHLILTLLR